MFTIKKGKEGLEIDLGKPHSTMELHYFKTLEKKCDICKKTLKEGEECGLIEMEKSFVIAHKECPK